MDGVVTYADLFAVPAFRQLARHPGPDGGADQALLEQQWLDPPKPRILHVSKGFAYRWDTGGRVGLRAGRDSR